MYLSSFGLGNRPERLLRLLRGGKRAAVVINAKDGSSEEGRAASLARELDALTNLGLDPSELDLRDHFNAPESLGEALHGFDLIWVRGGNTFVLRRALRRSGADAVLAERLATDSIVYSGFSAGVTVLGPSLRGLELVDDPELIPEGYDREVLWSGLGLLPYTIVPHYRSDHPESDRVEALVDELIARRTLFKVLKDGEAIVIDGERIVG